MRLAKSFVVVLFTLCTSYLCSADDTTRDWMRRPLSKVRGVYVSVTVGKDIKDAGVTPESVRTAAELILRQSGIRVLSEKEWSEIGGLPFLQITFEGFNVPKSTNIVYLYGAHFVEVLYSPRLGMAKQDGFLASTWQHQMYGVNEPAGMLKVKNDATSESIGDFVNDYLAMNPKK